MLQAMGMRGRVTNEALEILGGRSRWSFGGVHVGLRH